MRTWLIVRAADDVDTAYKQATELLASVRQQNATSPVHPIDGVWIDATIAAQPPTTLSTRDRSGKRIRLRVRESTGLSGVWLLCRIEADEPGQEFDRTDVLEALVAVTAESLRQPLGRVVPVFSPLVCPPEKRTSAGPLTLVKK